MIRCLLPVLLSIPTMQSAPASRGAAESRPAGVHPISELGALAKPKAGTTRVLLVRHGQSVGNATRDDPTLTDAQKDTLSERGKAEAAQAGAALRAAGVARLVHSPNVRARETAEIARAAFDSAKAPALVAEPAFRGIAIGKSPVPTLQASQYLGASWQKGEDPKLEGGETLADVAARARDGAKKLAGETGAAAPIAIVTHGEVVAAWLAGFEAKAVPYFVSRVKIPNASIAAFDLGPGGEATFLGVYVLPEEPAASRPK